MKEGIHPTYFKESNAKCACGATFSVGSTEKDISVEICSACHPFYTGKQKLVDTAGRVDKFKARIEAASKAKSAKNSKKVEKEIEETIEVEDVKTKLEGFKNKVEKPAGQSPLGGADDK
jgi:large subunit ribosomal protein L31